jgi:hypothetical protein
MWIKPFWRGPEDGALSQAVHMLKKTDAPTDPPPLE